MVGWGILFIAIFLAIFGTMVQMWKGLPKWIVAVCATIVSLSVSVAGSYLYENLKPFLPPISNTTSSDGMTKQDMGESNDIMQNEELPGQNTELSDGNSDFDNTNFEETMPDTAENESTESEDRQESPSYDTEPETTYSNETVLNTGVEATKENISPLYNIEDITGVSTVTGKIKNEGQKNRYKFTSRVNGVYRFDSDLSAGGSVKIRISGENDETIDSGTNNLTIYLEKNKTYIMSVEYRDVPCDYTVNIGVPIAVTDITEEGYISGCIRYRDQTDRYLYTAPDTGTYRFSTDLDAGGKVKVRIGGENGNSIKYAINDLSVNLEEGKTYMLSVEYENGPCFYEVFIEEDYE